MLCHGSGDRKGGLDLRTVASRLKGGKSGPGLVPGKPEESLIYQRIVKGEMPPDKLAKDLAVELPTASETEKIRAWIAAGAPGPVAVALPPDAVVKDADRQFWSFQPPQRPRRSGSARTRRWCAIPSTLSCCRSSKPRACATRARPIDWRSCGASTSMSPAFRRRPQKSTRTATTSRPTPTKGWWTACSPRRAMASAGASTGSIWPAIRIPKASGRTMACAPRPGAIATT